VIEGHRTREQALSAYGAFSDSHERKYRWLLRVQQAVGQLTPSRAITAMVRAMESERLSTWAFAHYLDIAPPSFVAARPARSRDRQLVGAGPGLGS
jgi:menaquinone-9 beta-reductase